jgi:hypothetical protein
MWCKGKHCVENRKQSWYGCPKQLFTTYQLKGMKGGGRNTVVRRTLLSDGRKKQDWTVQNC